MSSGLILTLPDLLDIEQVQVMTTDENLFLTFFLTFLISGIPIYIILRFLQNTQQSLESTQHQLITSQKKEVLSNLTSGIAHDFNNILAIISANANMISSRMGLDELDHHIKIIESGVERGAALVKKLMIMTQDVNPELVQIDVNQQISEITEMMSALVRKNIIVTNDFGDDLELIKFDKTHFNQILLNLIINAQEVIEDNGVILIQTYKEENSIIISVSDNGSGIPEDIHDKIFDPFFSTKVSDDGTGIGLSVVQKIVSNNNGSISIDSEIGVGTTFIISLPV